MKHYTVNNSPPLSMSRLYVHIKSCYLNKKDIYTRLTAVFFIQCRSKPWNKKHHLKSFEKRKTLQYFSYTHTHTHTLQQRNTHKVICMLGLENHKEIILQMKKINAPRRSTWLYSTYCLSTLRSKTWK